MDTAAQHPGAPDTQTWYVISEIVDDRYQVSIATGPDRWAECTFPATGDMTHPQAVTTAVERFTGRPVIHLTTCRPHAPGCPRYRITVAPEPANDDKEISTMEHHDEHATEIVIRTFTENGCVITAAVADPADAQRTLYGTVTRDGILLGSYYCADFVRQSDWRIVTPGNQQICFATEPEAVYTLTISGDPSPRGRGRTTR